MTYGKVVSASVPAGRMAVRNRVHLQRKSFERGVFEREAYEGFHLGVCFCRTTQASAAVACTLDRPPGVVSTCRITEQIILD